MQRMLEDIREHAQRMEDSRKMDLSILDKIKETQAKVKELANKWGRHADDNGFYYYLAVRTVGLVLDKMEERFSKALENKGNQEIAVDTMTLA